MPDTPPNVTDTLERGELAELRLGLDPTSVRLSNYLRTMNALGPDAEDDYERALRDMKSSAADMATTIARAEAACPQGNYQLRWGLVYAAVQLHHASTLPFLRKLVLTEIPPEEISLPHSSSTVAEETIIRTTAVEGIGYLAKKGKKEALNALFEFLASPSISIRRASVQELLKVDKRLREKISASLQKEFHYLLDIAQKNVRDVPQVKNPKRHLKDKKLIDPKKGPPPAVEEERLEAKKQKSPRLKAKE